MLYLDSSAVVKLVNAEAESAALRRFLRRHRARVLTTSALTRVEVVRAVAAGGRPAVAHARRQLGRLHLIPLGPRLLDEAAELDGTHLRSLDAIHLASARLLGPDLRAVVTYDRRMASAAADLGLTVETPA